MSPTICKIKLWLADFIPFAYECHCFRRARVLIQDEPTNATLEALILEEDWLKILVRDTLFYLHFEFGEFLKFLKDQKKERKDHLDPPSWWRPFLIYGSIWQA